MRGRLTLWRCGCQPFAGRPLHFANDERAGGSIATSTINAKSETAATKPAFRDPIRQRRCLIPADGFYEWQRTVTVKQPYCFEVSEGELFAFAGIWDGWKNAEGQWIKTCSILTTTPNAVTSSVHDRMPVILHPDSHDISQTDPLVSERTICWMHQ
jgi:putative SOS response-associated peptidase YedK